MCIEVIERSSKLSILFILWLNHAEHNLAKIIWALDLNNIKSIIFIDIIRIYNFLLRSFKNKICIRIFNHKYILLHFNIINSNRNIMTNFNRLNHFQFIINIININASMNLYIDRKIYLFKNALWYYINFEVIIQSSENRKLIVNCNFCAIEWKSVIGFGIDWVNIIKRYKIIHKCCIYHDSRSRSWNKRRILERNSTLFCLFI